MITGKRGSDTLRRLLSVAGLAVTLAWAAHAQTPRLLPVDDAASRPEFFSFRAHLQRAIASRDVPALLGVVHPDIRNTFGDDNGADAFKRLWRIDRPDSDLWRELGTVLALGGTFDSDGRFVAPYTFSRWDGSLDAFEHVALVAASVRIRARPDVTSPTLATLSFAILPTARPSEAEEREGWTAVRLSGRVGYVASSLARSPIDYRAIFSNSDMGWRLVTFIAGD